jgi:Spy/CpxP family protein refolding chaperone
MPAHFNKVINDEQRPKIIAVLQDHAPKIQQLRAELASLVEKRDEALQKVLTPTQRRQLEELRAEASAKRAAASANGDESGEDEPKQPKRAKVVE